MHRDSITPLLLQIEIAGIEPCLAQPHNAAVLPPVTPLLRHTLNSKQHVLVKPGHRSATDTSFKRALLISTPPGEIMSD